MKTILAICLALFVLNFVALGQSHKLPNPAVLKVAAPVYPFAAIPLRWEAEITCDIKIDSRGVYVSATFDHGDKIFHNVIEEALKEWRFERSHLKERLVSVRFIFKLLSNESTRKISSVFTSPNIIEVFSKKIKEIDSPG